MSRLKDWHKRFNDVVESSFNRPFKYGENDCAILICRTSAALNGHDLRDYYPPITYTNEEESVEYTTNDLNADSPAQVLDRHFYRCQSPKHARMGDIIMLDNFAFGVVLGEKSRFFNVRPEPIYIDAMTIDCQEAWCLDIFRQS